jgi:predicted permease
MLQDLRYAVRVLLQSKGWTAMVVLSLALGIGANTALFSAVNGLLLKKLDVSSPDTLVRLRGVGRNEMSNGSSDYGSVNREGGLPTRATFSYPMFEQLKKDNRTLSDLFAGAPMGTVNMVVDGQAEIVSAYIASGNYHGLLGVRSVLGRTLAPGDDQASATPVAVLSHGFWKRRFGSDPKVVGKVVHANNTPITIVGVTSPGFTGVQRVVNSAPDMTFPLALDPQLNPQAAGPAGSPPRLGQPTYWWLQVMGRLKPGATAEQVEGNLQGPFQQTARQGMDAYLASLSAAERGLERNRNRREVPRLHVSSGARGFYDINPSELRGVTILSIVVGLILLIVCANVANLLLSRAAAQQKELSVRLSLGATRFRLIRQLLTESVLLSFVGAGCGMLVAYWGRQLLPGSAGQAPLDWRVLSFACVVALATGVLFGIAPALRATGHVAEALKQNSRSVTGSRGLLGKSLLVAQVAISLVLLIGAGLFLRTVENLRRVNVGFNPTKLVLFRVNPALNRYDATRIGSLYAQLTERLQATPGVRAVTLANPPMLTGSVSGTSFVVQGRPFSRGEHNSINQVRIAPNFFEAMEVPVLLGRAFAARDDLAAPKVAIINEAAVKKFFAGQNPLGQRFGHSPENSSLIEIVGVVRDIKYDSVRDAAPATMYLPYRQYPAGFMAYVVRTAQDPTHALGSIREAARQVDPNVPLMGMTTQLEQIEQRFSQEKVFAQAYALFGGLAVLVASIGLFGVMSYSVARRTNEIGIRMALGAERREVVNMIMSESLSLVAIGLVVGAAFALSAAHLVGALLFGLAPWDAPTLVAAMLGMSAVSAFAGYLPARRAARVDPIVALHYE